jgi:hypothetical protein
MQADFNTEIKEMKTKPKLFAANPKAEIKMKKSKLAHHNLLYGILKFI